MISKRVLVPQPFPSIPTRPWSQASRRTSSPQTVSKNYTSRCYRSKTFMLFSEILAPWLAASAVPQHSYCSSPRWTSSPPTGRCWSGWWSGEGGRVMPGSLMQPCSPAPGVTSPRWGGRPVGRRGLPQTAGVVPDVLQHRPLLPSYGAISDSW